MTKSQKKLIARSAEALIYEQLNRGKSLLLLGPRQTGKTTLLKSLSADLYINLVSPGERRRYEGQDGLFKNEIKAFSKKKPLVILDEIQKVPDLIDEVQEMIDSDLAQFILTGSSVVKLKRRTQINLLPGRLVTIRLDPLMLKEVGTSNYVLEDVLSYGSLPGIFSEKNALYKQADLISYVDSYLDEEIRMEALVRQVGTFSRFLELAAIESGKIVNFSAIAQNLGLASKTIQSHYEILCDSLICERIEPLTKSQTRKKLTKSCKFLFFDLGVQRICTKESASFTSTRYGELFEDWVGLEIMRNIRSHFPHLLHLYFWRDHDGPEVDWVIASGNAFIPIEVKWAETPHASDAKHLKIFLNEYPCPKGGYIICRTPRKYYMDDQIQAISWKEIHSLINECVLLMSAKDPIAAHSS